MRGWIARHRETALCLAGMIVFLALLLLVQSEFFLEEERALMRSLRMEDAGQPRGPAWCRIAMLEISALGSGPVLCLVTAATSGLILAAGRHRAAGMMLAGIVAGISLSWILKAVFGRTRPDVIPHYAEVASSSFPSGHAMQSAVVYGVLAVMLARVLESAALRRYVLAVAAVLVFLIGLSRVYLGVHYPTDVLAGWSIGMAWAALWSRILAGTWGKN